MAGAPVAQRTVAVAIARPSALDVIDIIAAALPTPGRKGARLT